MFTLAHLSDLHVTPLRGASPGSFLNKRFYGLLSWTLRRGRLHRTHVLEALIHDLAARAPDHVAVTGDLTNVALEQEFVAVARWLRRWGDPRWVSVIPGNHDAYVPVPPERSWAHLGTFLASDPDAAVPEPFPTVRVRGEVALVGVSTAVPTPPFRATGTVGAPQLGRLEALLGCLGERELCRIVMIHHPPTSEGLKPRRELLDAEALCAVLARAGAELVIHGHSHQRSVTAVAGPRGPIPVVGVRSGSHVGHVERRRAQYHLYRIERRGPSGTRNGCPPFRIRLAVRGWSERVGRFVAEGTELL
ncbi:MAG: metallophosphoesterase [Deferrisomatales bacterium]